MFECRWEESSREEKTDSAWEEGDTGANVKESGAQWNTDITSFVIAKKAEEVGIEASAVIFIDEEGDRCEKCYCIKGLGMLIRPKNYWSEDNRINEIEE